MELIVLKNSKEGKNSDMMLTFFFLPLEPSEYSNYNDILNAYMKDINFINNKEKLESLIKI